MLVEVDRTKQYVLASGASHHNTRAMHEYMCFSSVFCSPTLGAPAHRLRDINGKYFAQFAGSSIAVDVIVIRKTHLRPPVGPKRSVLILSG